MLYHRQQLPLKGDAYTLPGFDPSYRKLIEDLFRMINALEGQRVLRPREDQLPPGYTWSSFQQAILDRHSHIASYLRTGVGLNPTH